MYCVPNPITRVLPAVHLAHLEHAMELVRIEAGEASVAVGIVVGRGNSHRVALRVVVRSRTPFAIAPIHVKMLQQVDLRLTL